MHIPGHVLDPTTAVATGLISTAVLLEAARRVRSEAPARLPLIAGTALFVFAAQMLNFPVAGGTSGHFLGGAMAGILLGPWAGMLAVASVLAAQCLLFGDGGLDALGANILNMAVLGAGGGFLIYRFAMRDAKSLSARLLAVAIAAATSVMAAATFCSVELSIGGGYPLAATLRAMLLAHAPVALVEAAVSSLVVACVARASARPTPAGSRRKWIGLGVGAVALLMALAPFASALPDGLEMTLSLYAPVEQTTTQR